MRYVKYNRSFGEEELLRDTLCRFVFIVSFSFVNYRLIQRVEFAPLDVIVLVDEFDAARDDSDCLLLLLARNCQQVAQLLSSQQLRVLSIVLELSGICFAFLRLLDAADVEFSWLDVLYKKNKKNKS